MVSERLPLPLRDVLCQRRLLAGGRGHPLPLLPPTQARRGRGQAEGKL